ncbi:hypothetical protein VZ94_12315 [Methylocucumis oryzae]|uniref:Uncharacterized protein n=1 Tax=Methylocucumis oryzae TaxID=1632867 RepID=A0A0F3IL74_9GAMM|nr:hypothetical protein VZ94_12315 [Methylocucumis oryzae]
MLNYSLYCFWISGGPPNDYPEAWYQQGIISGWYSITLLVSAIFAQFTLKQIKKSIFAKMVIVLVLLGLCYPYVRQYLLIDNCLDSGGSWSSKYFKCGSVK